MSDPSPDQLEEALADVIDNVVPTRGYALTPLVGLGGSAGAIPALKAFFPTVPPDSGLAFVVVLHLAAERESIVADILQRHTAMPVRQVGDKTRVEPNSVYVIPPGKAIESANGYLELTELASTPGRRLAVDLFFRALADTHAAHSAAVVLSGGNADGTIGIKRVKERGGLTIAQDPLEAQHASMPASAIATGMIDWILPVSDMAGRLLDYFHIEKHLQLPAEDGPQPASDTTGDPQESSLHAIQEFLRARTGRDFSCYKRATLLRRVARRMQVNGVHDLAGYLGCLRTRQGEAGALLQDLLVSVTNFFRDAQCFSALADIVPALFIGKGAHDAVRVWVAACATGEEAYSMAMLLAEHADTLEAPPAVQVFATDPDELAIQTARDALYPAAIEADVAPERLRRFFTREAGGYRVRRELRECVLFAVHDLLKDTPFSRLDLVSCRNLLISLDTKAQAHAFDAFDFALLPSAKLFLGAAETLMEGENRFSVVDKKHRIYAHRRRGSAPDIAQAPPPRFEAAVALERPAPVVSSPHFDPLLLAPARKAPTPGPSRLPWGELHLALLEHLGPPSLLINGQEDIVHLSPSAGAYLQHRAGEPTRQLLRLVRPELRVALRTALLQAAQGGRPVITAAVTVGLGDAQQRSIALRVVPASDDALKRTLVLFEPAPDERPARAPPAAEAADPLVERLDRELERLRAQLADTVEQYEQSTQELKASNEELHAINEELRSATEELETSREELQAVNEELLTVNQELTSKVEDLAHSNSDMQNLMDSTAIATIFLNRDLRITRYTPTAIRLFHLIPSDLGRPLTDLTPG